MTVQSVSELLAFLPSLLLPSDFVSSSSLALVMAVLTRSWMCPWMFCQNWSMLVLWAPPDPPSPFSANFLASPFSVGFLTLPPSKLLFSLAASSMVSFSSSMSASSDSDLSEMSVSCFSSSDLYERLRAGWGEATGLVGLLLLILSSLWRLRRENIYMTDGETEKHRDLSSVTSRAFDVVNIKLDGSTKQVIVSSP